MKKIGVLLGLILIILTTSNMCFGQTGRYQGFVVQEGRDQKLPKVLILDTNEGHLWIWSQSVTKVTKEGMNIGTFLEYQGKLRPGKKMGDRIEMNAEW